MLHPFRHAIIASTLLICLSLSGCSSLIKVHRLDVQQGNLFSKSQLEKLHRGMTRSEVIDTLGQPVLTNPCTPNQLIYVYTWQKSYGKLSEKQLIIHFHHDKMTNYKQRGVS